MQNTVGLKNMAEDAISSYEDRIQSIGSMFDVTDLMLGGFQESLIDTKEERERINTEIRDILAKNEHLRRKDFDSMMQGILSTQAQREKEIRNLLKVYLNEHKGMAEVLRENLGKFKNALAAGEAERVKEFQNLIKEIFDKQENRKKEVTSGLKRFQKEQDILIKALKELLAKGNNLRIRDFKSMLKEFDNQRQRRLALRKKRKEEVEKRKEEVRSMLGKFKKERRR